MNLRNAKNQAVIYCSFDGVANVYHGMGTQTQYFLSCLSHRRVELEAAVGDFDAHIVVPDFKYSRPGYAVNSDVLAESLARIERAQVTLWEAEHDEAKLFEVEKWHQICSSSAETISGIADEYDRIIIVACDAIYTVLAEHLDLHLSHAQWLKVQLVHFLGSTSRIPGTALTVGREEAERALIARANNDPRVFIADLGSYLSEHLVEVFGLIPLNLRPFRQALSLDEDHLQPETRSAAIREVGSRGIPLDLPIILAFGRADPIKGFDRAIEALTPLRSQLHFVLIAAPYKPENEEIRRYRDLLSASGLRYSFFPQFERSLPRSLCSLAETVAVLVPSLGEPCGQVPQEVALWARDAGPVVIVSDEGGLARQIRSGVTGFVYSQGSISDMTDKIDMAVRMDAGERRDMRKEASATVMRERDYGQALGEFLRSMWVGDASGA